MAIELLADARVEEGAGKSNPRLMLQIPVLDDPGVAANCGCQCRFRRDKLQSYQP